MFVVVPDQMKLTKASLNCHSHKGTSLKSLFCFHLPHYPHPVLGINPTKVSACNAGDPGLIPGSGRSPGEGNGNPLQYSCLGIPWTQEPQDLQSRSHKELDTTERLHFHFHFHPAFLVFVSSALATDFPLPYIGSLFYHDIDH